MCLQDTKHLSKPCCALVADFWQPVADQQNLVWYVPALTPGVAISRVNHVIPKCGGEASVGRSFLIHKKHGPAANLIMDTRLSLEVDWLYEFRRS